MEKKGGEGLRPRRDSKKRGRGEESLNVVGLVWIVLCGTFWNFSLGPLSTVWWFGSGCRRWYVD
jgi:hypothetical protein